MLELVKFRINHVNHYIKYFNEVLRILVNLKL